MSINDKAGEYLLPNDEECSAARAEAICETARVISELQPYDSGSWGVAVSPNGWSFFGDPRDAYEMVALLIASARAIQHKLEVEKAIDWEGPMGQTWWRVNDKLNILELHASSAVFGRDKEVWERARKIWHNHNALCKERNKKRGKTYGSLVHIGDITEYIDIYGGRSPTTELLDEWHFQRVDELKK